MQKDTHPRKRISWTEDTVTQEAQKYQHKRHFRESSSGAYSYASKHKMLEKICSHMDKTPLPDRRWNENTLREVAQQFSTPQEFLKNDSNAYNAAKRKGMLELVCSHKDTFQNPRKKPFKKLSKLSRTELEAVNRSRINIGAKPIEIKIRKCMHCKIEFESTGDRSCGCFRGSVATARLTGFDVI